MRLEPLEDRTLLSAGSLDLTFGVGGIVTTGIPDAVEANGNDVAIQSDGRIVVVGQRQVGTTDLDEDLVVARYNADGSLDSSFGSGGMVIFDTASRTNGRAVAIDDLGRIVVAGIFGNPGAGFVVRLLPNGTFDTTFSGDGFQSAGVSGYSQAQFFDVDIQQDGKIVAAGSASRTSTLHDFLIVRFNDDGTLDTTFDGDGRATHDFASHDDLVNGLEIDSSGRIVVVGQANLSFNIDFGVARFNPDGTLDTSFATGGAFTLNSVGGSSDRAQEVVVDADGKIVFAGRTNAGGTVVRLNNDGSLDTSFGGSGIVPTSAAVFKDVALQNDGKILASGEVGGVARVYRFNVDGSMDSTFSGNGIADADFTSATDSANGVAIQADGKIVIAGIAPGDDAAAPLNVFGVARFEGDIQPINFSGTIFDDVDNDGVFEPGDGEFGIGGVTVTLAGTDAQGPVNRTTVTLADGSYNFDNVFAGDYTLTADQASGFLDGNETAGSLGGTVDNSQDSNTIANITIQNGDPDAIGYNFGEIRPSDALGLVWQDFNNDGEVNFGEKAIENVTVNLDGTDDRGNAVNMSVQTDGDGIYMFFDLRPGTYDISEVQPSDFDDGIDALGTVNSVPLGDDSVNDVFSGIVLDLPGSVAQNYNFGERPPAGVEVTSGQTATIGFWMNKNGQELIESLNGGPSSTQLAGWLSSTFVNMYGVNAGANDLTGMTNDAVADFYSDLFRRKKKEALQLGLGGPVKMDAQVMALSLATYVTNETLAGTVAESYGFFVTEDGVGVSTFNVGDSGEAFDVADNTDVAILDLLFATNDHAVLGVLYDEDGDGDADDEWETLLRTLANDLYSTINEAGDI